MISTGSRAALALTFAVLITGCDQGSDDGSELGDGPSTIGDVGDDTTDTSETGSDDATSSSDSGSSDTTDSSSSDTSTDTTDGTTGDPLPCEGMVVSIEADFYNSDGVHLAPTVFDQCMTIGVFGGNGLTLTATIADGADIFVQLPGSLALGETPITNDDAGVQFDMSILSVVPAGWQGDYGSFAGVVDVSTWGLDINDHISATIAGTLNGPEFGVYFADVVVTLDVDVLYL